MLARVYMTLAGYPYNDTNAKSLAKTQLENVLDRFSCSRLLGTIIGRMAKTVDAD